MKRQAKQQAKQTKRILTVKVRRMDDESPDTSWLGKYSNMRTSEFSIDRAHEESCMSIEANHREGMDKLGRVTAYLDSQRLQLSQSEGIEWGKSVRNGIYTGLSDAEDILTTAQDELAECDCGSGGNWDPREYRYFNPSFNYVDSAGRSMDGNTPEEIRKYVAQDYARIEALSAGEWGFIGIRAEANIRVGDTLQTIVSGGLWGIESDSREDYLHEVEGEELADLRAQLYALGFSKRAIAAAVREARAA
jgi:hypothetical protein